jgi:quercetin dioxygenase-like cupin family protein
VTVQPWREPDPPTEAAILQAFAAEGLRPYRWSNGPGDVYGAHSHPYHKVIRVVTGSITFGFPGGGPAATLAAGDRLDLPPGVAHDAVVGTHGVVCLEAHRSG